MSTPQEIYRAWRAQPDLDPAMAAELAAIEGDEAVSYTHLTLPTKLEV